ncbi:MAG: DsrE family protein [Solirubrobacterales bacterium]
MPSAAIVILAGVEDPSGTGRVVNALMTAGEFKEEGDEVVVIFDGAGVKWVPELANPEGRYHRLLASLGDSVAGACAYCAQAYGVREVVEQAGVRLISEYKRHPSLRSYAARGYQIITF